MRNACSGTRSRAMRVPRASRADKPVSRCRYLEVVPIVSDGRCIRVGGKGRRCDLCTTATSRQTGTDGRLFGHCRRDLSTTRTSRPLLHARPRIWRPISNHRLPCLPRTDGPACARTRDARQRCVGCGVVDESAILYLNQPIEVASLREQTREVLGQRGHLQLLLRMGRHEAVPHTARRAIEDVLA